MSELVSATRVPLEGAAALSVTVQVAEPPLPPPMMDGLQARDVTLCAWAVGATSAKLHIISAGARAIKYFFVASVTLTRYLLLKSWLGCRISAIRIQCILMAVRRWIGRPGPTPLHTIPKKFTKRSTSAPPLACASGSRTSVPSRRGSIRALRFHPGFFPSPYPLFFILIFLISITIL